MPESSLQSFQTAPFLAIFLGGLLLFFLTSRFLPALSRDITGLSVFLAFICFGGRGFGHGMNRCHEFGMLEVVLVPFHKQFPSLFIEGRLGERNNK